MPARIAAIGLSLLATCASAVAQDAGKAPRLATVDASGRVLPLETMRLVLEKPETPAAGPAPCAAAKPMRPEDARALVARIAEEEKFDTDFVQAVAKNESGYNSVALSGKGAFGLMQLLPQTAERFKVDLCDPADNVRGGIRFLRALQDKYKNPFFILAAYNAGEEALVKSRGVPAYPETVRFVAQVINDVFSWPAPAVGARDLATARASVIELTPQGDQKRAAAERTTAARQWNDGFVMHVD